MPASPMQLLQVCWMFITVLLQCSFPCVDADPNPSMLLSEQPCARASLTQQIQYVDIYPGRWSESCCGGELFKVSWQGWLADLDFLLLSDSGTKGLPGFAHTCCVLSPAQITAPDLGQIRTGSRQWLPRRCYSICSHVDVTLLEWSHSG